MLHSCKLWTFAGCGFSTPEAFAARCADDLRCQDGSMHQAQGRAIVIFRLPADVRSSAIIKGASSRGGLIIILYDGHACWANVPALGEPPLDALDAEVVLARKLQQLIVLCTHAQTDRALIKLARGCLTSRELVNEALANAWPLGWQGLVQQAQEFEILRRQISILHHTVLILYISSASQQEPESYALLADLQHTPRISSEPIHLHDMIASPYLLAGVIPVPRSDQSLGVHLDNAKAGAINTSEAKPHLCVAIHLGDGNHMLRHQCHGC